MQKILHHHDVLSSMRKPDAKTVRRQLGEMIRSYRVELGISQEKLAELVDVHRNYVGKIERGEQNITINSLCRFAEVFKRSLSEMMADAGL
jgi:transcriptional regulator with XRE-family HTH domain